MKVLLGATVLVGLFLGLGGEARAQTITVDIDQAALTRIVRKEVGERWTLMELRGTPRLVLDKPEVTITPGGIHVGGTLRSTSPDLSSEVEIRLNPVIRNGILMIDPATITVTRPTGVLGLLPRKVLGAWIASDAARAEINRIRVDLTPLIKQLGGGSRSTVAVKLGLGRVSLVVTLK
jgi:hypothetical protein